MRSELENIQYIESYLQGKLDEADKAVFEAKMIANPSFKSEVENQKNLEKAIKRSALLLTLNDIHGDQFGGKKSGKAWWANIWLNVFVVATILGAIGYVAFAPEDNPSPTSNKTVSAFSDNVDNSKVSSNIQDGLEAYDMSCHSDSAETGNQLTMGQVENPLNVNSASEVLFKSKVLKQEYFLPQFDTLTYVQGSPLRHSYKASKTIISLPTNLIEGAKDGETFKLLYREYRNPAQTAFSGIPMIYKNKGEELRFNSAGMFEFIPLDSSVTMNAKASEQVDIDFELTQNIEGTDYYVLENNNWKKIGVLENNFIQVVKNIQDGSKERKELEDRLNEEFYRNLVGTPKLSEGNSCDFKIQVLTGTQAKLSNAGFQVFRDPLVAMKKPGVEYSENPVQTTVGSDEAVVVTQQDYSAEGPKKLTPIVFNIKVRRSKGIETYGVKVKTLKEMIPIYKKDPFLCLSLKKALTELILIKCRDCEDPNNISKENYNRLMKNPLKELELAVKLADNGTVYGPGSMFYTPSKNMKKALNEYIQNQQVARIVADSLRALNSIPSELNKFQVNTMGGGGGHSHSAMVRNLSVKGFGVYNCDGVSRIQHQIVRGIEIDGEHIITASLIDLSYNAAFSFNPKRITMDAKGNNVVLLFTNKGKLLFCDPTETEKLVKNKKYQVQPKDLTMEVNSSADLYDKLKEFIH